ncbi:unnamed protein product, partial [Choristocarpus tenellus]
MTSSRFAGLATGLRDLNYHVNALAKSLTKSKTFDNPNEKLLVEAGEGRVQNLQSILQDSGYSIDVNKALDPDGLSPLCLACANGHEEVAMFLLTTAGADPNNSVATVSRWGIPSPLMLATGSGLTRVVDELLSRNARVDARRTDGWTSLHVCASKGHAFIMQSLLSAPLADTGIRTARLETPLSIACSRGHLSIVDMLLGESDETISRGHVEEKTWMGRTPLHRAAAGGHVEVILKLLSHGASLKAADRQGATPLFLAARGGYSGAVRTLLSRGASVQAATMEGDTALHVGVLYPVVVRLIVNAGADVDHINSSGSTALHLAAAAGATEAVLLLLSAGASPSLTNSCGLSPGSCFLLPPSPAGQEEQRAPSTLRGGIARESARGVGIGGLWSAEARVEVRELLAERRQGLGHLNRLAEAHAKSQAVRGVGECAAERIKHFISFVTELLSWDLNAREHIQQLNKLDTYRSDILVGLRGGTKMSPSKGDQEDGDGVSGGADHSGKGQDTPTPGPTLLLDLSSRWEDDVAQAVERRGEVAATSLGGMEVALAKLEEHRTVLIVERREVVEFLWSLDPALAFSPGRGCLVGSRDDDYNDPDDDCSAGGVGESYRVEDGHVGGRSVGVKVEHLWRMGKLEAEVVTGQGEEFRGGGVAAGTGGGGTRSVEMLG